MKAIKFKTALKAELLYSNFFYSQLSEVRQNLIEIGMHDFLFESDIDEKTLDYISDLIYLRFKYYFESYPDAREPSVLSDFRMSKVVFEESLKSQLISWFKENLMGFIILEGLEVTYSGENIKIAHIGTDLVEKSLNTFPALLLLKLLLKDLPANLSAMVISSYIGKHLGTLENSTSFERLNKMLISVFKTRKIKNLQKTARKQLSEVN